MIVVRDYEDGNNHLLPVDMEIPRMDAWLRLSPSLSFQHKECNLSHLSLCIWFISSTVYYYQNKSLFRHVRMLKSYICRDLKNIIAWETSTSNWFPTNTKQNKKAWPHRGPVIYIHLNLIRLFGSFLNWKPVWNSHMVLTFCFLSLIGPET